MPPKGRKTGGSSKRSEGASRDVVDFQPLVLQQDRENWLTLEFKLLNWKYMNFNAVVRDDTHIFTIKKMLRERHGQMKDLRLCLHAFTEANEVKNDMLTLAECGLKGEPKETRRTNADGMVNTENAPPPTVLIFYDYKPCEFEDPVLLYFNC